MHRPQVDVGVEFKDHGARPPPHLGAVKPVQLPQAAIERPICGAAHVDADVDVLNLSGFKAGEVGVAQSISGHAHVDAVDAVFEEHGAELPPDLSGGSG